MYMWAQRIQTCVVKGLAVFSKNIKNNIRAKQIRGVYYEVRHKRKLTELANLTEINERRTNILIEKKMDKGSEQVTSK